MVNYNCEKCGKQFNQKCHYDVHMNRKKICNAIIKVNDVLIDDKQIRNSFKINIEKNEIKKEFECVVCGMTFTRAGSLKRHLVQSCSKIEDTNKLDFVKIVNELKEQNNELKKMVMQLINNNKNDNINNGTIINGNIKTNASTNNINNQVNDKVNNQVNGNVTTNNNIKIEFGKEDLSKLSNDFFIKTLINSSGAAIPCKIIEGIHFNLELKENMNVYITDGSRNKAMVHDGKQWNIANADEVVNTLFDKAIIFCEDRNEELYDKIQKNDKIKKKINKEMHVMDIMSNNRPYEYNEHKEPVDAEGNVLDPSELKRGVCLNGVAKEHIRRSLCNKKEIIIKK